MKIEVAEDRTVLLKEIYCNTVLETAEVIRSQYVCVMILSSLMSSSLINGIGLICKRGNFLLRPIATTPRNRTHFPNWKPPIKRRITDDRFRITPFLY